MTTDRLIEIIDLADKYADAEARAQQGYTNNVDLSYYAREELISSVQKLINQVVQLDLQLEKYQPVKQKVPALLKPPYVVT